MSRTAAALLALVALARSAGGQGSLWEREVREQLRQLGGTLTEQGYQPRQAVMTGSLGAEERESFTLALEAGKAYALVGVCDEDCRDLDLRILDGDGSESAADTKPNAFPMIQIQPPRDGEYRVQVIMKRCTYAPCHYGVGIFVK